MEVIAQVFNWKITKTELEFEENLVRSQYPDVEDSEIRTFAVNQLIDRYLLMQEAINKGISVEDEEFEDALLDMMDLIEAPETSVLVNRKDRGEQIERIVKSNLFIKKYIDTLDSKDKKVSDDNLHEFYQERKDYFCKEQEVRASHILIKGREENAQNKINSIRESIRNPEDFSNVCSCESECPSGMNFGDLGYFPRGRMIPAIDEVAFSLKINEISQPFLTKYGYHILMVTDIRDKAFIPFDEIKDCLKDSLKGIEREITIKRILSNLHKCCKQEITIFEDAFE